MDKSDLEQLYLYLEKMFSGLEKRVGNIEENMATKKDIDDIMIILDRQSEMLETDELERLALSAQVGRHEDRLDRVEAKLKLAKS